MNDRNIATFLPENVIRELAKRSRVVQLETDEANGANVGPGVLGFIDGIQSEPNNS